jgi:hypothetical protein
MTYPVGKVFSATVRRCARCGIDHLEPLEFRPLLNPPADLTHFGMCPETAQPILMTVKDDAHPR